MARPVRPTALVTGGSRGAGAATSLPSASASFRGRWTTSRPGAQRGRSLHHAGRLAVLHWPSGRSGNAKHRTAAGGPPTPTPGRREGGRGPGHRHAGERRRAGRHRGGGPGHGGTTATRMWSRPTGPLQEHTPEASRPGNAAQPRRVTAVPYRGRPQRNAAQHHRRTGGGTQPHAALGADDGRARVRAPLGRGTIRPESHRPRTAVERPPPPAGEPSVRGRARRQPDRREPPPGGEPPRARRHRPSSTTSRRSRTGRRRRPTGASPRAGRRDARHRRRATRRPAPGTPRDAATAPTRPLVLLPTARRPVRPCSRAPCLLDGQAPDGARAPGCPG
jgi:hypothetical protein